MTNDLYVKKNKKYKIEFYCLRFYSLFLKKYIKYNCLEDI